MIWGTPPAKNVLTIRDKTVSPVCPNGNAAFGCPILEDAPAARMIAEIIGNRPERSILAHPLRRAWKSRAVRARMLDFPLLTCLHLPRFPRPPRCHQLKR